MTIRLWKTPKIVMALMPWFVCIDQSVEDIAEELADRLENEPDKTFCLVVEEANKVQGFIAAFCRENDVFLWQAQGRPTLPQEISEFCMDTLANWTREKGYNKVVTKSPRKEALIRKWHFVEEGDCLIKRL